MKLAWANKIKNFGDSMSPIIFEKLTGAKASWCPVGSKNKHVTLIGSFINEGNRNTHVFGTGFLKTMPASADAHYHVVRGPLSREMVVQHGGKCPRLFCDPGLLVSKFWPSKNKARTRLGIVFHHREHKLKIDLFNQVSKDDRFKVLDIRSTFEFLEELEDCHTLISSTLHGLVAAHAYGIPAIWMKPTNKPLGTGIKFVDYLKSVDLPSDPSIPRTANDLIKLSKEAQTPTGSKVESMQNMFLEQFEPVVKFMNY